MADDFITAQMAQVREQRLKMLQPYMELDDEVGVQARMFEATLAFSEACLRERIRLENIDGGAQMQVNGIAGFCAALLAEFAVNLQPSHGIAVQMAQMVVELCELKPDQMLQLGTSRVSLQRSALS